MLSGGSRILQERGLGQPPDQAYLGGGGVYFTSNILPWIQDFYLKGEVLGPVPCAPGATTDVFIAIVISLCSPSGVDDLINCNFF